LCNLKLYLKESGKGLKVVTKTSNYFIQHAPTNECDNQLQNRFVLSATGLVILFSLLMPCMAFADGFTTYGSGQAELKQSVIKDVGDAEQVDVPDPRTYGSSYITRSIKAIKLADKCFQPITTLWGNWSYGKKAALLLEDKYKSTRIALLENEAGSSIKVDVMTVTQVDCTDKSTGDPRIDIPKQEEDMLRRQEDSMREFNRLKGGY
jgi:hypothetical protein